MAKLILEGSGGNIELEINLNDLGWSKCYLVNGDRTYLGAETSSYICSRLLDELRDDVTHASYVGEINEHKVRGVLALSEMHHVLYCATEGSSRILFWQDSHQSPVKLVGVIRISSEQRMRWREQLENVCL